MNKIMEELIMEGVPVCVEFNTEYNTVEYIIDGFYKSDKVKFRENENGVLISYARYDEENEMHSIKDVVKLNYDWWEFSRTRASYWSTPHGDWLPLLKKYEFVLDLNEI